MAASGTTARPHSASLPTAVESQSRALAVNARSSRSLWRRVVLQDLGDASCPLDSTRSKLWDVRAAISVGREHRGWIDFARRHGANTTLDYPTIVDRRPSNRYLAGTFQFAAVPPPLPPILTKSLVEPVRVGLDQFGRDSGPDIYGRDSERSADSHQFHRPVARGTSGGND